eukprot:TRINITY_DN1862_c0_g1_i5.p1 TRINITY_DN1862_c0_g1~~TRINITY_DN1862_c0_g1_i5.p1  ORF type:complete len:716 (+),score=128.17 TRINITY_DN1862_c0_g1_i5:11-2158(+)
MSESWTVEQVVDWALSYGHGQFLDFFIENQMSGAELPKLTKDSFINIIVTESDIDSLLKDIAQLPRTRQEVQLWRDDSVCKVRIHGNYSGSCGYCKARRSSQYGMYSSLMSMSCDLYEEMADFGWTRSGTFIYHPHVSTTCCPLFQLRTDVKQFRPSKSQKRVVNRFQRFLNGEEREVKPPKTLTIFEFLRENLVHAKENLTQAGVKIDTFFNPELASDNMNVDEENKEVLKNDDSVNHNNGSIGISSVKKSTKLQQPDDVVHCEKIFRNILEKAMDSCFWENQSNQLIPRDLKSHSRLRNIPIKSTMKRLEVPSHNKDENDLVTVTSVTALPIILENIVNSMNKKTINTDSINNNINNNISDNIDKVKDNIDKKTVLSAIIAHTLVGTMNTKDATFDILDNNSIKCTQTIQSVSNKQSNITISTTTTSTTTASTHNNNKKPTTTNTNTTNSNNNNPRKNTFRTEFIKPTEYTPRVFEIFKKFQVNVHHEPAFEVTEPSFTSFLIDTPLKYEPIPDDLLGPDSVVKEYGSYLLLYILNDEIVAVSVLDILPHSVFSVYFMWDTDYREHSLGIYSATTEIVMFREKMDFIKYYYLGWYVPSCPKMRYKALFKPAEVLCPITKKYVPLDDEVNQVLDNKEYYVDKKDQPPQPPTFDEVNSLLIQLDNENIMKASNAFEFYPELFEHVELYLTLLGTHLSERVIPNYSRVVENLKKGW